MDFTPDYSPDRYYREHDAQINLFNAAEHVLKDIYHLKTDKLDFHHIQESYQLMEDKKAALTSSWKTSEKELKDLQSQLKNLQEYLGTGGAESMQSHAHEENHEEEKVPENPEPKKNSQSL